MDTGSDSSKCELESITSGDSLQIITDEFRLHNLSTPDVTNAELSKKVLTFELDNERLRIDLENTRLELNAKNAANQGLKNKIAELYVDSQKSLQERQKLQNLVKDAQCKVTAAENSAKWYQGQMHEVQASKRTLQIEIDTYQSMLKQKNQILANVTAKWKELNDDYLNIVQKHREEKNILEEEITFLKSKDGSSIKLHSQSTVPISIYEDLSIKLESIEEELQVTRAKLRTLEQRLISTEIEKTSIEYSYKKQRTQMSSSEDSLQRCQSEKTELADTMRELQKEFQNVRSENEMLQESLLCSGQEREQVEDAINQLRSQITKMLAQHKLLKNQNAELEKKLNSMQSVYDENKRLKSLLLSANSTLFKRLRQERKKASDLQKQLYQELQARQRIVTEKTKIDTSLRECLKQTLERNEELKKQLKSTKISSEESIDEGYIGSTSTVGYSITNIPSPSSVNPTLLNTINDVLSKSKHFWEPIHIGLNELHSKLEYYKGEKIPFPSSSNYYSALQISTPPPSPPSNTRSLA